MKHSSVVSLAQIALMTACIIVLGFIPPIPVGFIPTPIVVQSLGILLAGVILGPKKGTTSVALFLFMALIGLPVLTGQSGGPAQFFGPSSGYLYAWLFVPFLVGTFLQRFNIHNFSMVFVVTWIWGVLFMDLIGGIWLAWYTHAKLGSTLVASLVFIPGDTLKALLTAWIGPRIAKQINH